MSEEKTAIQGLLLVDHGTRNDQANAALGRLADRIARARPDWLVEAAHMELAPPDLASAVATLVDRGATEILVHLHFLVAGFHVRESLPQLLEKVRARHPGVPIELLEPLGDDPRVGEIVIARIDERIRR